MRRSSLQGDESDLTERYERKTERKLCYFIRNYVEVTLVKRRWMLIDNTWQEEEVAIECPRIRRCRRDEHNCRAIHSDTGVDPFTPFRDLLADMW